MLKFRGLKSEDRCRHCIDKIKFVRSLSIDDMEFSMPKVLSYILEGLYAL